MGQISGTVGYFSALDFTCPKSRTVSPFHNRAVFHFGGSGGRIFYQLPSGYWQKSFLCEGKNEVPILGVVTWETFSSPLVSSSHCLLHLQTSHGILSFFSHRLVFVWIIRGHKSWGCSFRILPTTQEETKNKMSKVRLMVIGAMAKVKQGREKESAEQGGCIFD